MPFAIARRSAQRRHGALALLVMTPIASANFVFQTASDLNLAISDDAYNGTLASMACVSIPVTGVGAYKVDSPPSVKVWIDHTWIGDLVMKLVSPLQKTVTLMSRPGLAETADDGTSGSGDDSNLVSTAPIEFVYNGPKSAESMGDSLGDSQAVCRDDAACVYNSNSGAASPGNLASFNTDAMAGTWKFCVGDAGPADVGTIQQVQLTFSGTRILFVSTQALDFGGVVQGTSSVERFVTLTAGFADVTVSALTFAAAPFVRDVDGTCGNSLPFVVTGSTAGCTLGYSFTPTTQDLSSQEFTVQSDGGMVTFTLKGSGDAVFVDGFEP